MSTGTGTLVTKSVNTVRHAQYEDAPTGAGPGHHVGRAALATDAKTHAVHRVSVGGPGPISNSAD